MREGQMWRVRLARWVLRAAAWLAWRIGGKAAFGRSLAELWEALGNE